MENIQTKSIRDSRDVHDLTFYKFAIESLPVAVMTVDPDLRITGFNPSAEEVTGYSKEETVGKHCGEILKGELCKINCPLRTVLNHRRSIVRTESTIYNKFGEIVPSGNMLPGYWMIMGRLSAVWRRLSIFLIQRPWSVKRLILSLCLPMI